jgi:predicted phage terminase large subunit-like protein
LDCGDWSAGRQASVYSVRRRGAVCRIMEKEEIQISNFPDEMVAEARELYLKFQGRRHVEIEREMQERGWPFYRELLYARRRSGRFEKGWPDLYGWKKLVEKNRKADRPAATGARELENWLEETFPEWKWKARYQRFLYEQLNRVTDGKCKRLMIFMPPRHGKSETVTVRYTAWRLLRDPKLNVILGSYNQRLADRFSRKIKRIVENSDARHPLTTPASAEPSATPPLEGGELLAATASVDSPLLHHSSSPRLLRSVSEWETTGGGVVRSVGVGGGIAGFGAGLIVIDDPVRNRADAESETYREKVWDWFNDDIYTRLEPNAAIILIQTRWHEDDLAGRLLKEEKDGGEKWDVINFPAIATENDQLGRKPGQALCSKRYSVAALERIKKKLGSYSFSALYQQDPVPAKGGRFRREWFKTIVDAAPDGLRWKRGYDLAISIKTSADYTASFRCAFDRQGNLYIADGFRKRMEFPDQRRYIIERMQNEPGTEHGIESAMHGKAVVQELRREPTVRRYAFREVPVDGDKLTRALSWLNLAEAGKVFLVRGPWIDDFIDEVCRFPSGRYDDQVDAVSIAVSMLSRRGYKAMGF